jgi:hypothetical protein
MDPNPVPSPVVPSRHPLWPVILGVLFVLLVIIAAIVYLQTRSGKVVEQQPAEKSLTADEVYATLKKNNPPPTASSTAATDAVYLKLKQKSASPPTPQQKAAADEIFKQLEARSSQ